MISRFKPYPAYKDAGVPWLGQVPEHLGGERLRDIAQGYINGVRGGELNGRDNLTWVRLADSCWRAQHIKLHKRTMRAIEQTAWSNRLLRRGDLLLENSGGGEQQPIDVIVLHDHEDTGVCSSFIARVPVAAGLASGLLTYLHAVLHAIDLDIRTVSRTTGIRNLDSAAYLAKSDAVPSLPKRRTIAHKLGTLDHRMELDHQMNQTPEGIARALFS